MRNYLKKKLLDNSAFSREHLAESAAIDLEHRVYEKKQASSIYQNSMSGLAMQIVRANKAKVPFDVQGVKL